MAKLLIISAEKENWAVKQLVEKAEEAGLEVEILNPNKAILSIGENPFICHDGEEFTGADLCLPRLSEENLEYKTALLNQIETSGIKVINTAASMHKASNKIESQVLLTKAGLKTPKTVLLTCESQLDNALQAIGEKFPVIVKTIYGTHGCGVVLAESKKSLKSIIDLLLKSEAKFMLQECIEHTESARILMLNGEPLAAVMRTVPTEDFRSNAHLGAELKLHEPTEAEISACKLSCEALEINFAAIDYIISGDDILILEVNGSPGFEAMQEVVELDIAKTIIEHCLKMIDAPSDVTAVPNEGPEIVEPVEPEENPEGTIELITKDGQEISIKLVHPDELVHPEEKEEPLEVDIEHEDAQQLDDIVDQLDQNEPKEDHIIGTTVDVIINHFDSETTQEARVDTGAKLCSINGSDIEVNEDIGYVKFKFEDTTYKFHLFRMIKIKQVADSANPIRRPVIQLDMIINGVVVRNAECTINDRDHMKYSILLGRQVLADAGVLVDPSLEPTKAQEEE